MYKGSPNPTNGSCAQFISKRYGRITLGVSFYGFCVCLFFVCFLYFGMPLFTPHARSSAHSHNISKWYPLSKASQAEMVHALQCMKKRILDFFFFFFFCRWSDGFYRGSPVFAPPYNCLGSKRVKSGSG